jgi:hypothetical protein
VTGRRIEPRETQRPEGWDDDAQAYRETLRDDPRLAQPQRPEGWVQDAQTHRETLRDDPRLSLPRPRVLAGLLHTDESTVQPSLEFLIKAGLVYRDAARLCYFQWIENEADYM